MTLNEADILVNIQMEEGHTFAPCLCVPYVQEIVSEEEIENV
jgi:hypothetical protein